MLNNRNWFTPAHPPIGVVAITIPVINSYSDGIFRSDYWFIFGDLLGSLWQVQFYYVQCTSSMCFWVVVLCLLELFKFFMCEVFLWGRDWHLFASFGLIYHINITCAYQGYFAIKIKSVLVGGMFLHVCVGVGFSKG